MFTIPRKSINPILTNSKYRPDIDGLRGVAVLLVVMFHAFPEIGGGGFVGVDVFFVISGFLITGIIVNDLNQARFSFKTFYARRVKRLYPALLLTIAACYGLGWFLLLPNEFMNLGKHITSGAGFVSNFVLLRESNYFDVQTELKPLLHLWSLGIEEQFYLIWPLLIFLAYKKHIKFIYLFSIIFIYSFVANLANIHNDPVSTFYLPQTRFWELMSGAMIANLSRTELIQNLHKHFSQSQLSKMSDRLVPLTLTLSHAAAFLGIISLGLSVVFLNKNSVFPGWGAALPTMGAALIIGAGQHAWPNKKLLAHPILVFFGMISYPLYLWHWPLLAFTRIANLGQTSVAIRFLLVLLSMLLSWLTYQFVETPIRFGNNHFNKTFVLSALMVLTFAVGYSTYLTEGLPFRMTDKAEYANFFNGYNYPLTHGLLKHDRHDCSFFDSIKNIPKETIDPSCVTPHSKQIVFVWGDSHAQHLNYGLCAILPPAVSLLQVATSSCPPSATDLEPDPFQTCNKANRFVWDQLAILKPDVVILAQKSGHDPDRYDAVLERLKNINIKTVLLIGPVPQWKPFLYQIILRKYWQHPESRINHYLDQNVLNTDEALGNKYKNSNMVQYVSLISGLCNEQGCLAYLNNDRKEGLITYDYGHFTLPASEYVARTILAPVLNPALNLELLTRQE